MHSGTKYEKSLTILGNNEGNGCKIAGKIVEIIGKTLDNPELIARLTLLFCTGSLQNLYVWCFGFYQLFDTFQLVVAVQVIFAYAAAGWEHGLCSMTVDNLKLTQNTIACLEWISCGLCPKCIAKLIV